MTRTWLRSLFAHPATRPIRKRLHRARPALEALEDRCVPSTLTPVAPSDPFAGNTADNVPLQEQLYGSTNYPNSQVEPYVVANPTRANNLVGIWQQDRWNDGGARGLVVSVSMDHGNSWKAVPLPGVALTTGGTFARASDPWLSFAPNGDLYASSLFFNAAAGPSFPFGSSEGGVQVSKSTDGGLTWSHPITLIDTKDPLRLDDKESITADPTNAKYVYAVWDQLRVPSATSQDFYGPTYFARSTNGGKTWEPAHVIYDPGIDNQTIGNEILVLPNGTLLDVFTNPQTGVIEFVKSTDHGATWSNTPTVIDNATFASVFDPNNGNYVRTGDIFQQAAVDPHSGNLYVVWQDGRFTQSSGVVVNGQLINAVNVAFTMSTDGGQTWSSPIAINQTPTNLPIVDQQAFNPQVAVAEDGTVAVTYYDLRNAASAPGLRTDFWAVLAKPGSPKNLPGGLTNPVNWKHEVRLTVSSFDLEKAPMAGGLFLGDYIGLTSSGNRFLTIFIQSGTSGAGTSAAYSRWFGPFGSEGGNDGNDDGPGDDGLLDLLTPVFGTSHKKVHPGF
jgi:hypothetical protein